MAKEDPCNCPVIDSKMCVIASVIFGLALFASSFMIYAGLESDNTVYTSQTDQRSKLDVSGSATREVEPDLLVIQVSVKNEDESAEQSQSVNAQKITSLKTALKNLGINDKDIQTSYYNVNIKRQSHYICKNKTEETDCYWEYVTTGYETTHQLTIEVENLDKGGEIIDVSVAAGASEIDGITFGLKPETQNQLKKELLQEATQDAWHKAEDIASSMPGVSLDFPISISESYSYSSSYSSSKDYLYEAAEAGSSVSPGQITVSASVRATYEISESVIYGV